MSGKADAYFSVDVETDGAIPGQYSLLSIGVACMGLYDGNHLIRYKNPSTFYRMIQPLPDAHSNPEALAVSGFTLEELVNAGDDPRQAFIELDDWVYALTPKNHKAVFVGYPAVFDWLFTYWYSVAFANRTPFGFSSALDIKTAYAIKASVPISRATKKYMPKHLFSKRPHTHNALDDALEQGDLFMNIIEWEPNRA